MNLIDKQPRTTVFNVIINQIIKLCCIEPKVIKRNIKRVTSLFWMFFQILQEYRRLSDTSWPIQRKNTYGPIKFSEKEAMECTIHLTNEFVRNIINSLNNVTIHRFKSFAYGLQTTYYTKF